MSAVVGGLASIPAGRRIAQLRSATFVQAVKHMHGEVYEHGEVHDARCFIVTTRWPDLDWRPHTGPATCGFCAMSQPRLRP